MQPVITNHKQLSVKEFCVSQGDKEKALGLSVSPLMDRAQRGGITRSQVHFGATCHCDAASCNQGLWNVCKTTLLLNIGEEVLICMPEQL